MFSSILLSSLPGHVEFFSESQIIPFFPNFGKRYLKTHLELLAWSWIQQPFWEGSQNGPLQQWRSWGRSSLAVGALLPLAPAWTEPHKIPGRNPWEKSLGEVSSSAGSAPAQAVVGHLFPADLFREG